MQASTNKLSNLGYLLDTTNWIQITTQHYDLLIYHQVTTTLKICNKEVLFVDSFTYLGSLITNDGSSSRDVTSRIAKAASAIYRLSNPLFRKHRISIQTKINMYRALVVSVLLYGSEAWATTLADRRRLDVSDMRCQRCLMRVFWQQHISNHSIRERTKQPTASSLLWQHHIRTRRDY